jgi:hypothetical protein
MLFVVTPAGRERYLTERAILLASPGPQLSDEAKARFPEMAWRQRRLMVRIVAVCSRDSLPGGSPQDG